MENKTVERIFLCGFMGAGKTSIGQNLAQLLNYSFKDLDDVIEQQAGTTITEIFDQKGEQYFRQIERQTALTFLTNTASVVALGGGSLQDDDLTRKLKHEGLLVFIDCPIPVILARITGHKKRPLLLDEKGEEKELAVLKKELKTLYRHRLPRYKQADIILNSHSFASAEQAAYNLYQQINEYNA